MQYNIKVSPIQKIDAKYLQTSRQDQMKPIQKSYKYNYNYNKNKRNSDSKITQQKGDVVEISVQGLNALKQHKQSMPPTQSSTTNMSYISNLIANYEK